MVGRTLNHYKIVSSLGKGGMGEVYAAEDTKLGRKVALKVLPQEMADNPERRSRFEREAKAVAALNHPNIVTIYSVEEADPSAGSGQAIHFLTMELIEGKSLSATIPARGMRLAELLDHGIAMADALSAAHKLGITHRDLKPDNIMFGADGRLKVLDFGLAKLREDTAPSKGGEDHSTQSLTQEGKILGTVAYMSPEQAEGKPVDARSDVFSLGVIVYEMATGQRPFKGDTAISTLSSVLKETPISVTDLNESLPRHLSRVIGYCLAKEPEGRYQSASELRRELEGLRQEVQSGEDLTISGIRSAMAPPPRPASRGLWIGVAIAAMVAAVAAVAWWRSVSGPQSGDAPASAATMEMVRLTSTGDSREGAISPDGNYAAFVRSDERGFGLWVAHIGTGSKVEVVPPSTEFFIVDPAFAPDSDYVYYIGAARGEVRSLYRVPVLGGEARKIVDGVSERVSFSPDGTRFVFNRELPGQSSLVVSNLDGSDERIIATGVLPEDYNDPAWSPDGKTIVAPRSGVLESTIVAIPAEGGPEEELLAEPWFAIYEVAWLADGRGLVVSADRQLSFLSTQIWEISYPGGQPRHITNDLNHYEGVTIDASGTNVVTTVNDFKFDIMIWSPETNETTQTLRTSSTLKGLGLTWTPDGRIVHAAGEGPRLDIWIVNADGSEARKITDSEAVYVEPKIVPDGKSVVCVSNRSGDISLWRVGLGGGTPVRLTHGGLEDDASISPNGRWMVYVGGPERNVYKMPLDGGDPIRLNDKRSREPLVSPEGDRIAVRTWDDERKRWRIEILPIDGGEPLTTLDIQSGTLQWSPSSDAITFAMSSGTVSNLWEQPLDGGPPKQLSQFDELFINSFAWSPDGRQIAISRVTIATDVVLLRNIH